MLISKRCQYALRAVFELALRDSNQPIKIHEIASRQNIPPRFLEVILNGLRHAGFVDSRRGNEGGYMLAKSADNISIGEIIRFIQGPLITTNEAERTNKIESFYGDFAFDRFWDDVKKAISQVCDKTTFAELIECEKARKTKTIHNYSI